jgi:hypothetical protein
MGAVRSVETVLHHFRVEKFEEDRSAERKIRLPVIAPEASRPFD